VDAEPDGWCYDTQLAIAMFVLGFAAGLLRVPARAECSGRLGEGSHRSPQTTPVTGGYCELLLTDSHHTSGPAVAESAVASALIYPARKAQEPDPAVWKGKRVGLARRQPRKAAADM